MIVICAYCKMGMGTRHGYGVSHGYCPECHDALIKAVMADLPGRPQDILAVRGIKDVSYRMLNADNGPSCQRGM